MFQERQPMPLFMMPFGVGKNGAQEVANYSLDVLLFFEFRGNIQRRKSPATKTKATRLEGPSTNGREIERLAKRSTLKS
jgi:hypothetical protein